MGKSASSEVPREEAWDTPPLDGCGNAAILEVCIEPARWLHHFLLVAFSAQEEVACLIAWLGLDS